MFWLLLNKHFFSSILRRKALHFRFVYVNRFTLIARRRCISTFPALLTRWRSLTLTSRAVYIIIHGSTHESDGRRIGECYFRGGLGLV